LRPKSNHLGTDPRIHEPELDQS